MPSPTSRIQKALSERLKSSLPKERVDAFVGRTHTESLRDNVVPSITDDQLATLREQLAAGDGGELRPRPKSGKTTAHAPYSSAALALNAFGGWLGYEDKLTVAGLGDWTDPLRIEEKLQIAHGGGRANLDVLLTAPGRVLAVESKLSEYVAPHDERHLKTVYASAEIAALLPGGWGRVLRALLEASSPVISSMQRNSSSTRSRSSRSSRTATPRSPTCTGSPRTPTRSRSSADTGTNSTSSSDCSATTPIPRSWCSPTTSCSPNGTPSQTTRCGRTWRRCVRGTAG